MPTCYKPEIVNSKSKPHAKAGPWERTGLSGVGASRCQPWSKAAVSEQGGDWLPVWRKEKEKDSVYKLVKVRRTPQSSAPSWLHQKAAGPICNKRWPQKGHQAEAPQPATNGTPPPQPSSTPSTASPQQPGQRTRETPPKNTTCPPSPFSPLWLPSELSPGLRQVTDLIMYFWKIPNWWGNHKNSTKNWATQISPEFLHPALCLSNASPQMQRTSNGLHLYSTLHSRVKFQPQPVAIQVRQAFHVKWQIHEISITISTEISWEQGGILQKDHMHSVLHVNNSFTANFLHFKNVNINWKNPKHLDGSFCRRQFVR